MELVHQAAVLLECPDWIIRSGAEVVSTITAPVYGPFEAAFGGPINALADQYLGKKHPMAAKLPLMEAPPVVFAVLGYFVTLVTLYAVGKLIGKLSLQLFAKLHNLFLFLLSLYMCVGIAVTAVDCGYSLWNNGVTNDANGWRMAKLVWIFYVSKIPEFIDTVIMILKQNYRQVSFLHLYHHATIFVIWFVVVREVPGGEAYFSAMLNSGVHVVMYGYYFLTIGGSEKMKKRLGAIKFYITYMQMTQFLCNVGQSTFDLYVVPATDSKYPRHLTQLLFYYMWTLLALFGNFLIQNKFAKKGDDEGAAKKRVKKD